MMLLKETGLNKMCNSVRKALLAGCAVFLLTGGATSVNAQSKGQNPTQESERSDKFTGGKIETAELQPDQPDIKLTLNIPSFRLTLWQNGKEVKSYYVGVGRREFPLVAGDRSARQIIWNPDWIPPDSNWVHDMSGVQPGEIIKASDRRNPIGKVKIPLGDGFLIHQAKPGDPGKLVSHGCIRLPLASLYELADELVSALSLPVSEKQIERAKKSSKALVANFEKPIEADINYDTLVVEGGNLHIYPDVYGYGTSTVKELRAELESSGVDASGIDDKTLRAMIAKAGKGQQFVVTVESIEAGRALEDGGLLPVVPRPAPIKKDAMANH
jgi:hypothetical protein